MKEAVEPLEFEIALWFLAVTTTVKGEPEFVAYVWLGVVSVTSVSVEPSPQLISNLVAFPVTVNVNVTVVPAPPVVISETKVTSRTYVFLKILKEVSLILSRTLIKLSLAWNPTEAPSFNVLKVPPNVVPSAVVLRLAISSSTYFFLAASVSSVGVAKPFTLVENKFAYFNPFF